MSVKYALLPWDLWQYGKAAVAPRFIFYSLSLGTQRDLLFLVSIFPTQEEHMVVSLAAVDKESIDAIDVSPLANRRGQTRSVYIDSIDAIDVSPLANRRGQTRGVYIDCRYTARK